jgi:hypothetical protein
MRDAVCESMMLMIAQQPPGGPTAAASPTHTLPQVTSHQKLSIEHTLAGAWHVACCVGFNVESKSSQKQ